MQEMFGYYVHTVWILFSIGLKNCARFSLSKGYKYTFMYGLGTDVVDDHINFIKA